MKKMFIPYQTILMFVLLYSNTIMANGPSIPPPPPGFEQRSASDSDLYLFPMVIIGITFTFFLVISLELLFSGKKNRV
jgi:hypothetical protein